MSVKCNKLELKGRRILVTRPEHQAGGLCRLIEQHGGTAVKFPVLEIVPVVLSSADRYCLDQLHRFDWVFFTSSNAVNFALRANNGTMPGLAETRVAAIGRATADSLSKAGIGVDLLPAEGFNSEALLSASELQQINGSVCLIVRGHGGRELLGDSLCERGAAVQYLEVYQRVKPNVDGHHISHMLADQQLDVITVTSAEALHNLVDLLGKKIKNTLLLMPLVVISDRIKTIAEQMGFQTIAVSAKPSDTEIINTVTALVNGEYSGRIE